MDSPLGRYGDDAPDELVTVQLLQTPLLLWQRTAEHHDEVMRELALLALSPPRPELPSRLLELVGVLGLRYGAAGGRPDAQRDAAVAAGLDRLDLSFVVPRSSGAAAERMGLLLEEVELYCSGALLTMAQPQEQVDFARWYVDQFVQQCTDGAPAPWPGPWD